MKKLLYRQSFHYANEAKSQIIREKLNVFSLSLARSSRDSSVAAPTYAIIDFLCTFACC